MPSLGPDMESARVIEWLVKPGDTLHRGDVIVVVETDKGAIEIEVFEDAVVEALIAPLDAELVVGAVMARLRVAGESGTDARAVAATERVEQTVSSPAPAVAPAPRRIHPSATSWTRDVGSMSSESAASASDAHSFLCGKRFVIASFNVIIGSPSRPRRCSRVLLLSVLSGDATRRLLKGSESRWTSGNDLFGSSSNQTDPRNLATLARSSSSVDGPASALATASAARGLNMAS